MKRVTLPLLALILAQTAASTILGACGSSPNAEDKAVFDKVTAMSTDQDAAAAKEIFPCREDCARGVVGREHGRGSSPQGQFKKIRSGSTRSRRIRSSSCVGAIVSVAPSISSGKPVSSATA
jgi:hypothetical protein